MSNSARFEELQSAIEGPIGRLSLPFVLGAGFAATLFAIGLAAWAYQIWNGLAVAGIRSPTGWGVYIADFVFWVGVAHSGTLISAYLFLFRAQFRMSFSRMAEAMTVISVIAANLFPLIHLGRVWVFYWLMPYPNQRLLWPNFRSPLVWDVFALNSYMLVGILFLFIGMLPDLAAIRDRSQGWKNTIFTALALGWSGSPRQKAVHHQVYRLLAIFGSMLVICVSGVVSWDFAMGVIPGWHATVFPVYFVAGALFSGLAMVLTLSIPLRKAFNLEKVIPIDHFEKLAKLIIFTAFIVMAIYGIEIGMAFYSGNIFEKSQFLFRMTGPYRFFYWLMMGINVLLPISLFVRKLRCNLKYLFVISILINVGMWLERFTIVVMSTAHDFDPYIWRTYQPTIIEGLITLGTFGLFFLLFLLFTRAFPVIPVSEIIEHEEGASPPLGHQAPLEWIAVGGALVGVCVGLGLTYSTALSWPLITGGKPIVSLWQYGIVGFEFAMLLGAISSVVGFFVFAGLPAWGGKKS